MKTCVDIDGHNNHPIIVLSQVQCIGPDIFAKAQTVKDSLNQSSSKKWFLISIHRINNYCMCTDISLLVVSKFDRHYFLFITHFLNLTVLNKYYIKFLLSVSSSFLWVLTRGVVRAGLARAQHVLNVTQHGLRLAHTTIGTTYNYFLSY